MERAYLLEIARRHRGLTQAELAAKAGTSQAALSAYERGLKSPSLKVASRIVEAAGCNLNLCLHIDWVEHRVPGVDPFWVPNLLWNVDMPDCFATLDIPDLINDGSMKQWDMRDREQRKGVYEQLVRCGLPQQMIRWVDGPLLVDLWDELDLPEPVRKAWRWAIVIAKQPTNPDPLRLLSGERADFTAKAWIRGYEPQPKRPRRARRPRARFVRTRFDPRVPAREDDRSLVDVSTSVAAIVERLVAELPNTRHPSAPATWNAAVAFARRWAGAGYDGDEVALTPEGTECVVRIAVDPFGDRNEVAARLRRL
ncbi:helix-turn-helix domain-containing protein [Nocardioides sp. Iso805N]|uniref:helix-turn-helix domain-containing protein n=1 Tax=Nocardioides sp. Iso805N TaxID=1283287 RepID=UPI000379D957|nr:helix-turn-helix transcriptional regulator [Nocardioides sp. Iso805N]